MARGYNMDYENYTEVGADSVYEPGENLFAPRIHA